MDKTKRTERVVAITKILTERPNTLFTFNTFCDRFGTAKSTMSEDISIIEASLRKHQLGQVETLAGASGGVRFLPSIQRTSAYEQVKALADELCDPARTLPGGFLYWSDVLSSPDIVRRMGYIIAGEYVNAGADFVLTMETKGIPLAMMTADALGIPLVIARHSSKVYEGSAVHINYMTGKKRIESMALGRRAVQPNTRALIVDDFIRAGGTASGMIALMQEFECAVVGTAFLMAQENPEVRYITGDKSLLLLSETDDHRLLVRPAPWLIP